MLVKMHCKYEVEVFGGPKCKSSVGFLESIFVSLMCIIRGDDDGDADDEDDGDAVGQLVGPLVGPALFFVSLMFIVG
jgi:hypothetical protein